MTRDPVADLAHDHADLNRRVLALAARIEALRVAGAQARSRDLVGLLDELREPLFLHFAREEEGVFPFVAEVDAELAVQVRQMAVAHDTICGALARMCEMAAIDAPATSILPVFERFEAAYADHARREAELLRALEQELDAEERRRLLALVEGL
jgi:iron-sulfur cluster repair protein YtfE (RIC family)